MPKNKKQRQKQIAKKVAKLIGATAALSPLVMAVPTAIGAEVLSPGTLPVVITPIQTQITNQLAGQSLNVGDSLTIDLDHIFQDAGQLMYTIAVQNYNVAKVTIQSGNLHISMKKKGTTMVTVTARKADGTGIVLERFRLTAETPSTLDMNHDEKIRVDDIVKYMHVHPGKNVEDYKSLLNTVKPYIPLVNLAPVANHSEITNLNVPLNGSIALSMDDFFSDEDGDLLSYRITPAMPSHGLNVNAYISSNILTITGQSYSSQALTITVEANDQQSTPTSTATHQFQVKVERQAPVALPDTYSVNANSTLTVNAATGVLHNDLESNDSGLNLIAIKETDPTHGTLSMFMDGAFVYTPQLDFAGTDSFTYKVWDGNKYSGAVTVYITVNAVNNNVAVHDIGLQYMTDADGIFSTEINLEDIFTNATEYWIKEAGHGIDIYPYVEGWFPRNTSDPTMLYIDAEYPVTSSILVEARSNPDEVPASYIIQLKVNQAPEFKGHGWPLGIKKGTTITLNAADWFIDPDGDPITTFTGSVYGSPSVTLNNPSAEVITVTADVYKGYTAIRLRASDGHPDGTSVLEYVDVAIVDEILSFGKGEREVSYDISDYVTEMNSGSLTAYLVESSSSLIESTSLSGTTLHLTADEDTIGNSEPVTVLISDGVTSEYIDLFMVKNIDEQVIFQPQSLNASIDISSYLSGMTGTVTANVYTPFNRIQSVSLSGANLVLTAKPDALGGGDAFVVQVSDGIITKYISVIATIPINGAVFFPTGDLTTSLDMTHFTSGMTGTVTATVYGESHPLIKSVSLTNNVLTLTAHNLGGELSHIPVEGFESIIIMLTDENMVTRRFVFHVFIPSTPQ